MNSIWQDVRYAVRLLGKSPGLTAVVVLTLALGIGANTTIFSMVNAVLLRSLPVRNSEQLVVLKWSAHKQPSLHKHSTHGDCHEDKTRQSGCSFSLPFFEIAQAQHHLFSGVAAFAPQGRIDLSGNGSATVVNGQLVSGDYFRTFGIRPALGRTIELSDDSFDAAPVIVLNYGYWRNAFGGDPSATGKTIKLNGLPFKIVGVIEPRFRSLVVGNVFDIFIPLTFHRQLSPRWDSKWDEDRSWWLTIVARLKPEVSRQQAQAATALLFRNAILDNPKFEFKPEDDPSVALASAQTGLTGAKTDMAPFLYLLMTAVVLILLIACANVAGLLLSRATTRQKEIAVRLALGAGRARVVRQLLIESILLAALGGTLGIVLASWSLQVLIAWISSISPQPLGIDVTIDARVLIFTLWVSFATGILFGLAPAFRGTRVDLTPALKDGCGSATHLASRGTRWLHLGNSLVVAQVGLSVVVLIGAGLLVRTLENLKRIDPGFDPRNVLLFAIDPSLAGYKGAPLQSLYKTLADQLGSIPGVNSVSYSETALITGSRGGTLVTYRSPGSSELLQIKTDWLPVSPGFFKTMRIPVLQGRSFTPEDFLSGSNLGAPDAVPPAAPTSVIVNEFFVRRYIEPMNPIGQMLDTEPKTPGGPPRPGLRIVGVVRDAKYKNLRTEINPTIYAPFNGGYGHFELRTAVRPDSIVPAVRRVVSRIDSDLPFVDIRTQSEQIDLTLFPDRLIARLSALFGLLALVLASIGLYGLLSYEVGRRTREIGIRLALGAQQIQVLRYVVRQGIILTLVGACIGIAISLGIMRFLAALLYGVRPSDPFTYTGIAIFLTLVALAACYMPARRATRVDPMAALRHE